jgi:amino acid adenylation domain-containing protein
LQYADYARWQQENLDGATLAPHLAWWQQQLAELPLVHSLPLKGHRPQRSSHQGQVVTGFIRPLITESLKHLANRHEMSLYMLLHGALALVISRYSNSDDIVIGAPIAGRNQGQIHGLVGYFANMLVLRVSTGFESFEDYVSHMRQVHLDAQLHQDLPFEQLVEHCLVSRSLQHSPLFQISFTLSQAQTELHVPELELSVLSAPVPSVRFDLEVTAIVSESGVQLVWTFDQQLFCKSFIARLNSSLELILGAWAMETPKSIRDHLASSNLLNDREVAELLGDTGLKVEYPQLLIHKSFEAKAAQQPNALAVVCEQESCSYEQLNCRANQLAHYLRKQGIGPKSLVALCLGRSVRMIEGILAVLKVGAAYLPLDESYPSKRLSYMLQDSEADYLITLTSLLPHLEIPLELEVLLLDEKAVELSGVSSDNPIVLPELSMQNPAYVIYTSGSTGRPKGVVLEHCGIINLVHDQVQRYDLTPDSRVLQLASFGFDAATWDWSMTLHAGGTLYIVSREVVLLPDQLGEYVQRHGITYAFIPPALLSNLSLADFSGIKVITIGGELAELSQARRWATGRALYNAYGPTENTVVSTVAQITENTTELLIGRPIQNVQCMVLNAHGELTPTGCIGELYVSGPGVARGYIHHQDLNLSRFITFPWGRFYRTGDLVCQRENGQYAFITRADDQVQLRGHRIELEEISASLSACQGVNSSLVLLKKRDGIEPVLVGYITADGNVDIAKCRATLAEDLPDYMVPSSIVVLPSFPLTPHGKIDRQALPFPEGDTSGYDYVAASNDTERALVDIWSQLLRIEPNQISVTANFFALGGHSLLVTRLLNKIRDFAKVELTVASLFDHISIRSQANCILAAMAEPVRAKIIASEKTDQPLVLSYAQQGIWFLDKLQQQSSEFNIPIAFKLKGLNKKYVEQALACIVQRHQVLRTNIVTEQGKPVGRLASTNEFTVSHIDLTKTDAESQEQTLLNMIDGLSTQPFDLSKDIFLRVTIIQLTEDIFVLSMVMHHISMDGWSVAVLQKELSELYERFAVEGLHVAPIAASLHLQYADFARWQRGWMTLELVPKQQQYWQKQLEELPKIFSLPTDFRREAGTWRSGATYTFMLEKKQYLMLQRMAIAQNVSLFMVIHGVFSILLSRYNNSKDVIIGTPVRNRPQEDLESLLGCFINTLVLRLSCDGELSFEEYLKHVRQVHLEAQDNQDIPFEHLVEVLNPERDAKHAPLFQILLNMRDTTAESLQLYQCETLQQYYTQGISKYDLTLSMTQKEDGILFDIEYDPGLYRENRIQSLAQHMLQLVDQIIRYPKQPIDTLSIVTPEEKHFLIDGVNKTAKPFSYESSIVDLYRAQLVRTPDLLVLSFENKQLSFAEFDQRVNQLANWLNTRVGTAPTVIALLFQRSVEMVLAIWAVMKAGHAWVPLDPELPPNRISYILQNSGASLLLSHQQVRLTDMSESKLEVIHIDSSAMLEQLEQAGKDDCHHAVAPDALAYLMYTSGSTGRPKGVMIEHRSLVNRIEWMQNEYPIDSDDLILQKTPYNFDVSVWEFVWPFVAGARLLVAKPGGHREPLYLLETIQTNHVTCVHFVPSMLRIILRENGWGHCLSLKHVFCSGEALQSELVYQHFQLNSAQLHNLYGPTEAAIDVSFWACEPEANQHEIPIGKPIQNIQLYVLNDKMQPQPVGIIGELYIGGVGLARGYINNESLTAEKFIKNPFDAAYSGRLYKTGDLACWDAEGRLNYKGRLDHQVKIRGQRIEPGEIEAVIKAHATVEEAIVVAREIREGHYQLQAYVVAKTGLTAEQDPTQSDCFIQHLQQFLATELPEMMLPSSIQLIGSIPLNHNGKIDRKALPEPNFNKGHSKTLVLPLTMEERKLCEIWQSELQVREVGIDDNFFALGGDSILAVRVNTIAREVSGLDLTVKDIFIHQTIRKLLANVSRHQPANLPIGPFELLTQQERLRIKNHFEDAYPLSMMQTAMIYHSQRDGVGGTYHEIDAMHLQGTWNQDCFSYVLRRTIAQYPILRTSYDLKYERPLQVVHANFTLPLQVVDISQKTNEEQQHFLDNWKEIKKSEPFDWQHSPLFSINIFIRSERTFEYIFSFHHSILDGWSRASFVSELFSEYSAHLKGHALPLKQANHGMREFIALENQALADQKASKYFFDKLQEAPQRQLRAYLQSTDFNADSSARGRMFVRGFEQYSTALIALASSLGVSVQAILLTVHLKVLSVCSGESRALTGVIVNGRPETKNGAGCVGLFLNAMPVLLELGRRTWQELIHAVWLEFADFMPYRRYPLQNIQLDTQCDYAEIMFNYTNFHVYNTVKDNVHQDFEILDASYQDAVNSLLFVNAIQNPQNGAVDLYINYDSAKLSPEFMSKLCQFYLEACNQLLTDPDALHFSAPVIPSDEIVDIFSVNPAPTDYACESTIHAQFEQQVLLHPQKVCVISGAQSLTYDELNRRANRLAHYLLLNLEDTEQAVAVAMTRSTQMLVAILAILKAGRAYLPIDLSYPDERIRFMLADSQVRTVVSDSANIQIYDEINQTFHLDSDHFQSTLITYAQNNPELHRKKAYTERTAYIIYTSGSTGKPKGVWVRHFNVINFLQSMMIIPGIEITDKLLAVTPISFDIHVLEIFLPLVIGAQVVICTREESQDAKKLSELILQHDIRLMQATPATWKMMLEVSDGKALQSLKVLCGGEPLTPIIADALVSRAQQVWNMYGPTECTVWSSCELIQGARDKVTIGTPIANTQFYVLDENQQLQAEGVYGELYIGGAGVAGGYLHQPDLTASKFVDVLIGGTSQRLYRTGDRVRFLRPGRFEFAGRIDNQVKLRGFRIELGEIEEQLTRLNGVKDAVVLIDQGFVGSEDRLVAYIELVSTAAASELTSAAVFKEALAKLLPDYMIPADFRVIGQMPLTPSGKLDRKALAGSQSTLIHELIVPAATDTEERLQRIWAELLQRDIEQICVNSNFFEIGGHSLLVLKMVNRIEAEFAVEVEIQHVFEKFQIRAIALLIDKILKKQSLTAQLDALEEIEEVEF